MIIKKGVILGGKTNNDRQNKKSIQKVEVEVIEISSRWNSSNETHPDSTWNREVDLTLDGEDLLGFGSS